MNTSTYFVLGMLAGLLLLIEGMSLSRSGGRLTTLVGVITLLEVGWLILCIYALFAIALPAWTPLIPAAYLAYFVLAAWQYAQTSGLENVEDLSEIRLPMAFARVEILTGIGLMVLSALAWVQFAEQLANAR